MFFEKVEFTTIDGTMYPLSNDAQVELWNCKTAIVDIFNKLDPDTIEMDGRGPDTLASWKKEFVKMLKEWDKLYVKHSSKKGTYEEMNTLHMSAMKPLTELIEANKNFHHLELMIYARKKKGDNLPIPQFRYNALEEKFC